MKPTLLSACTLALLLLLPACSAADLTANQGTDTQGLTEEEVAFIDSLFVAYTGAAPGAAVMIARGDDLVFCKGYGLADLDTQRPTDCDTTFRVGSVSKQFTAMAILRLVDAGRLRLSDSIVDLLPGFPESRRAVTVFTLLTHQSGLPSYGPITTGAADRSVSDADVVRYLQSRNDAYFPAGTDFRYSNAAYAVLAEIVAARAGMPFAAYMQEAIFTPAGMPASTMLLEEVAPAVRAMGYAVTADGFALNDQSAASAIQGDGSVHTSARDYYHWHRALSDERIVSPDRHQEAYRAQIGTGGGYGFGWRVATSGSSSFVGHAGSTAGFLSYVARIPASGIAVAIFTNRRGTDFSTGDLQVRAEALLSLATDGAHPMPPPDAF